jgi:hypothetical protein
MPLRDAVGEPRPGTGVDAETLRVAHCSALRSFCAEGQGGVYCEGLVSIGSVREVVADLGGWQEWLPPGARLFGCSAFGLLMATQSDDVWIVDTQYGIVVETAYSVAEFLEALTSRDLRERWLRSQLFDEWLQRSADPLPSECVLIPTPALPLGGTWDVQHLAVVSLPVYLMLTANLFTATGADSVEVRRRANG